MKIVLVRVGIDSDSGKWNAPVDIKTGEFVWVPIPEGCPIRKGMERLYADFQKALDLFALKHSTASKKMFVLPKGLERFTHLDPDFEFLSYGNPLNNKGDILNGLKKNDAVVFLRD